MSQSSYNYIKMVKIIRTNNKEKPNPVEKISVIHGKQIKPIIIDNTFNETYGSFSSSVLEKAKYALSNIYVETFDEPAINRFGYQDQLNYSSLCNENLEISKRRDLINYKIHVERIIDIIGSINFQDYSKKNWLFFDNKAAFIKELNAKTKELQNICAVLNDELNIINNTLDRYRRLKTSITTTKYTLQSCFIAIDYILDKKLIPNEKIITDRANSISSTIVQCDELINMVDVQISQCEELLNNVRNYIIVLVPKWINAVAMLHNSEHNQTKINQLSNDSKVILEQIKKG